MTSISSDIEQTKVVDSKDELEPKEKIDPVSITTIFRKEASDKKALLSIGVICSLFSGATIPAFAVLSGEFLNVFFTDPTDPDEQLTPDEIRSQVLIVAGSFLALGVITLIVTFGQTTPFGYTADIISDRLRRKYYTALLKRNISYFDVTSTGTLVSALSKDISTIQSGIGDKIGQVLFTITVVFFSLVISIIYSWQMTILLLVLTPIVIASSAYQAKIFGEMLTGQDNAFATATNWANDSLSGIRTVKSFNRENYSAENYTSLLAKILVNSKKKAVTSGCGIGLSFAANWLINGIAFGYGGFLIADGIIRPGDVIIVFFGLLIAGSQLGFIAQLRPDLQKASLAAGRIYAIIEAEDDPYIERSGTKTLDSPLKGDIVFEDIHFAYPTRKENKILAGFNLKIDAGKTTAFVGSSGGGKSTIVSLIERFYIPSSGSIKIDGIEIEEYDLSWLRENIGVVSQEPVLFDTTIEENVRFGRLDATDEEIRQACREANAHDFISGLEHGYATKVGEKGTQVSGGQKQRIAVARAILKNPAILLLDEATSALDSESEALVQDALERLMVGRTSIVIAHRLSTIQSADKICVFDSGKIVEQGKHEELLAIENGVYSHLVQRQLQQKE